MKSPWLPPLYVETEDTFWQDDGGEQIAFRVMQNGNAVASFQFFPGEAEKVIKLLEAVGVVTDRLERGAPEKPWFKKWRDR